MPTSSDPEVLVPILSAGKHRNPRRGACFMEFASYLAGERWSDHPSCTHPGLANLARAVNDTISNKGRNTLSPLIPSVIGLTTSDPRLEIIIALHVASAALPIASEARQDSLAVGAIVCDAVLTRMGGAPSGTEAPIAEALHSAPSAEAWAREFLGRYQTKLPETTTPRQTQALVLSAVDGIAHAFVDDRDERLRSLLISTIDVCKRFISLEQPAESKAREPIGSPFAA